MNRQAYPTDLTDAEWTIVEPVIPPAQPGGRKRTTNVREVLNAIFYLLRTGCSGRILRHDFPNWNPVYTCFRNWRQDGTWQKLNDALRREVRTQAGREAESSAAVLDSQSVKTTEKGDHVATTLARR
jgi:putative transposase